jgi:hypothetical protein
VAPWGGINIQHQVLRQPPSPVAVAHSEIENRVHSEMNHLFCSRMMIRQRLRPVLRRGRGPLGTLASGRGSRRGRPENRYIKLPEVIFSPRQKGAPPCCALSREANSPPRAGRNFSGPCKRSIYWAFAISKCRYRAERLANHASQGVENPWNLIAICSGSRKPELTRDFQRDRPAKAEQSQTNDTSACRGRRAK